MARKRRIVAENGIYHVVLRSIRGRALFSEKEDYEKFLDITAFCRGDGNFSLPGYCLTGDTAHLIIKTEKEPLSVIFKRICTRYTRATNAKYGKSGSLFGDRFKSEVLENDEKLLSALRFIHMLPVKNGLCAEPAGYEFSSYGEYKNGEKYADTGHALSICDKNEFIKKHKTETADKFIDESNYASQGITDEQVRKILIDDFACRDTEDFLILSTDFQNIVVKRLTNAGASIRQISRLTGMSKSKVEKTLKII